MAKTTSAEDDEDQRHKTMAEQPHGPKSKGRPAQPRGVQNSVQTDERTGFFFNFKGFLGSLPSVLG